MLLLAMRMMPRAASSASTPELFSPTAWMAGFWPGPCSGDHFATAEIVAGLMRPSQRLASVAVAFGAAAGHRPPVPATGARRLRADMQLAEIVDPGDRTAAIADFPPDRPPGDHDRISPAKVRSRSIQ